MLVLLKGSNGIVWVLRLSKLVYFWVVLLVVLKCSPSFTFRAVLRAQQISARDRNHRNLIRSTTYIPFDLQHSFDHLPGLRNKLNQ